MSHLIKIGGHTLPGLSYPIGDAKINVVDWGASRLFELLNQFSKCPQAKDFLARVARSVNLTFWYSSDNQIAKTAYTDNGPLILLYPNDDPLGTLAFELNNALHGFDNMAAKNGEQGIDDYAQQLGMEEYSSHIQRYDLWNACVQNWGTQEVHLSKPTSKMLFAFAREWDYSLDAYRSEWRKKYQSIFCQKHPKDLECTRPRDLRTSKFVQMESRFCNLYADAPKDLYPELERELPEFVTFCNTIPKK